MITQHEPNRTASSFQALPWERGRPARNEREARKAFSFASLVICFGIFFVASVRAQTPTPSPKPTPEPVTLGAIRGRVVSSDGRPLPNASVIAQGVSATPSMKMKQVDAEGAFVLEDLPAGLYIVMATAPGYIDETMTASDPTELPRHLIGSRLKITMIKGGVITGAVTDLKGQPVVGVPMQAATLSGPTALSSFMGGGSSETDDRGIYRMYGLAPGQYIVTAGGGSPLGQFTPSGFELDVPTYYPSSTRDTAVPVAVRSGDEATGIDIKYRGTEGHSISGVVLGTVEAGAAGGAIFVMLSHAGSSSILSMALATALEQRRVFSFNGVADGEYDLFAGFQGAPTDTPLVASKRVTVRNGDLTGVELRLARMASIAGTIRLDPIKDEEKCDQRSSQLIEVILNARRDDTKKSDRSLLPSMFGNVGTMLTAKGEFTVKNAAPGKYRFAFKLPTDAWYVRAITSGSPASSGSGSATSQVAAVGVAQTELSQGVVTIKSDERVAGVTISVGQDAAGLAGKLETDGAIPGGLRVHLVPAEREQANNVLHYSEAIVNSDATFKLTNLAPGRYFLVSRIKPETVAGTPQRDLAWDTAARTRLRTAAEAANTIVELKPCQRLSDYSLKLQPIP